MYILVTMQLQYHSFLISYPDRVDGKSRQIVLAIPRITNELLFKLYFNSTL